MEKEGQQLDGRKYHENNKDTMGQVRPKKIYYKKQTNMWNDLNSVFSFPKNFHLNVF